MRNADLRCDERDWFDLRPTRCDQSPHILCFIYACVCNTIVQKVFMSSLFKEQLVDKFSLQ